MIRTSGSAILIFAIVGGVFSCAATHRLKADLAALDQNKPAAVADTSYTPPPGPDRAADALEEKCERQTAKIADDPLLTEARRRAVIGRKDNKADFRATGQLIMLEREWSEMGCNASDHGRRTLRGGQLNTLKDEQFARDQDVRFEPGKPLVDVRPPGAR